MSTFNLPEETIEFLRAGRQFAYDFHSVEAGEVKLKQMSELEEGEVWINNDMEGDPHAGEEGYYAVPAISLTGECKAYDPDFILLWLPCEKLFGAWDCDHWVLKVFHGATWADIVDRPAAYLNAQWDWKDTLGSEFVPWPHYAFKSGRPF